MGKPSPPLKQRKLEKGDCDPVGTSEKEQSDITAEQLTQTPTCSNEYLDTFENPIIENSYASEKKDAMPMSVLMGREESCEEHLPPSILAFEKEDLYR